MSTPFENVFSRFERKIKDYSFLEFSEEDFYNTLEDYLISATAKIHSLSKDYSDYDLENKQFLFELEPIEEEIIATLMVVEYLSPMLVSEEKLHNSFSTKDIRTFSPANLLGEVRELRDSYKKEADTLMMRYSYQQLDEDSF